MARAEFVEPSSFVFHPSPFTLHSSLFTLPATPAPPRTREATPTPRHESQATSSSSRVNTSSTDVSFRLVILSRRSREGGWLAGAAEDDEGPPCKGPSSFAFHSSPFILDQLPALAPQTALVLGECVRAPALVWIREAQPLPRSRDPRFYRYWVKETDPAVDVESICALWEGKSDDGDETPATGADDKEHEAPS
jgi:hypothetical protein